MKKHIIELKNEIEKFNDENGSLYGFSDVVEVKLEETVNWEVLQQKPDWTKLELDQENIYCYEAKVNWSAVGMQSIESTEKFMAALNRAIEFAKEINNKLQ